MHYPNIFDYATSELSQDAFFAWLLAWADHKCTTSDMALCLVAKRFVSLLTGIPSELISTIEVGRQWEHIDIWAEINDDTFLVIEDKTSTTYHGTQLEDYRRIATDHYNGKRDNLIFTYIKTGNEPIHTLQKIKDNGYKTFNRLDVLQVLREYSGANTILCDYREYLERIETSTLQFLSQPMKSWDDLAWQGFYMKLNDFFQDLNWSYIPNQSGGFWGAHWNYIEGNEVDMYLQFEQKKLCFKIYVEDPDQRSALRNKYYGLLMEITQTEKIHKPDRFGCGEYMTIAIAEPDFMDADKLMLDEVLETLKRYGKYIEECLSVNLD